MKFKFKFKPSKKYIPEVGDLFLVKCYNYHTGYFRRLSDKTAKAILKLEEMPADKFGALNLETANVVLLTSGEYRSRFYYKLKIESFKIHEN